MDKRSFLKLSGAYAAATASAQFSTSAARASAEDGFIEITAAKGRANLHHDKSAPSDLWLYNDQLPGPQIRVKKGGRVRVRFTNLLDEPTAIHWHGIRIDNAMDGVSGLTQPPVNPGGSFVYDFEAPDAGTYWYHAHHMSWNQVPRGLAGPLIVEEDEDPFTSQTDLTLMLSDWQLDEQGRLNTESFGSRRDFSHAGRLGNWLTVNGKSLPDIPVVRGKWHRIRLINSSAARILDVAPERFSATIIALDGQAFDKAREVSGTMTLGPAQRMDLIMRPEGAGKIPFETMTGRPFTFANFIPTNQKAAASPLLLPAVNQLPEPDLASAKTLPLIMAGGVMGRMSELTHEGKLLDVEAMIEKGMFWGFNGNAGMGKAPMFSAERGETIIFESRNDTAFPHAMHIHGHHFRVLERNGKQLPNQDWRDTFISDRNETVKIAFVADNPGKWLIHCHMLGHAASGMTNWFEVV